MNKVILKGNVGGDPRITDFDNGGKVAQFTLATTERGFKTKDGKDVPESTMWHNIVVKRSGLAGVVEKFVRKGSPLLIEGKIMTRSYEGTDGQTRFITEINVENLELLGGGQKGAPAPEPEPEYKPLDDDDLPI